jgi:hypothetical protein
VLAREPLAIRRKVKIRNGDEGEVRIPTSMDHARRTDQGLLHRVRARCEIRGR